VEVVAARTLNALYIYLDFAWLAIFGAILLWRRKRTAFVAGLIGGLLYFIVDYGVFYRLLGTRVVRGADTFWFLLWLSLSYGFTNIAWIWLLLDRDGHAVEWSLLIILGWVTVALLSQSFGAGLPVIAIQRGTAYHGVMALIMAAGYGILILRNLRAGPGQGVNLLWLLAIGIGVQLSWELVLLISGIRPPGFAPLVVNSLIETNLGMPYFYLIHQAVERRRGGQGSLQAENARRPS
jgi:hypothetical protein